MKRFFVILVILPVLAIAQVKVSINSGNPAYPFPQFQPYVNQSGVLENLGTHNAAGVTHAEMEKTIREAYQIMMNATTKPGGGVGGKDYIRYNSSPQCSEGDGYGLLGAASMADKETFDGMWLYIHDFTMNKVKRYKDCKDASPGYLYSHLPGWTGSGANSATDGDVDIALALLCAYYQWGEFMGIKDACGEQISYKKEAIEFLKGMTDTLVYANSGAGLISGDIGLDGYFKGGDSWAELSGWATSAAQTGFSKKAEQPGPTMQYVDYMAPAYFQQFHQALDKEDPIAYAWNISQFKRAEASSDWIMGQLLPNPKMIPCAGHVTLSSANVATFTQMNEGEDFRLSWRTILNYIWNGNPSYSWDPAKHQAVAQQNTYERDIGQRYAKFLWKTQQSPWNNPCVKVTNALFEYWGPSVLRQQYSVTGDVLGSFSLNWIPGTGSPSAVAAQDHNLMAELYRTCEVTWDAETPGDGYLTSVPKYYHGWFRLLGMLVLSGNYQSPSMFKPAANCKIYCAIDKTFAFEKDTVTYTLDYRNYGSVDATNIVIIDTLHRDYQFVSATNSGQYNNVSHTVFWNIGTLPGFKTATGITPTVGHVSFKVVVKTANEKQYRNKASISCSNGTGWTSNEYPNNVTAVMQRNYLDIARRALVLDQAANKNLVKPGETVEFAIDFLNSSEAGWINGGRSGVRFSFAFGDKSINSNDKKMRFRLFHDAQEAYIDYGNYRMSYFLYDSLITCYAEDAGCTKGWGLRFDFNEGVDTKNVKVFQENIVPGQDSLGKWNQRIVLQFSDPLNRIESLSTIDYLVRQYFGNKGVNIHRGGAQPLRLQWVLFNKTYMPPNPTWNEHWSWDAAAVDVNEESMLFPVTNDWTDPDMPDVPIDSWHPKACSDASHTVKNILVEEWDGYTWRRVAGNGPMPGREANNVVIRDTIPTGFSFVAFTGDNPLGVAPTIAGNVITWKVPKMQIKEGGTISFTAKADGSCPGTADREVINRAWISADKESPFADSSIIGISCDTVIKPPPPDHIDIVFDTLLYNANKDEDMVRISMDEGTQTAYAYAVVRDRNGKFIRKVTGATWTSRDPAVVTAGAASATSWQGIMTKKGGGSTLVVVAEPANPALKPDSLAINAAATPPWPAISGASMGDANGDIIPDMLTLTLNDSFHVNQKLDSVIIDYRGTKYGYAATAVQLQKTTIAIVVPGITTVDPQPTGTVTMVMTVDGSRKQSAKEFTDGIGPALTKVMLVQDMSGTSDTLVCTFTEDVAMQTMIGATLQLIRTTGDTVPLTVVSFKGPIVYNETRAAVTAPAGIRPQEGDRVRLVPGVAGGTIADKRKNLPHLLNASVVIPERPSQISAGWYTDENADGFVDAVYLQFKKAVNPAVLSVSIVWGELRFDNIIGTAITRVGTDSTLMKVLLPQAAIMALDPKTDGNMFSLVKFTDNIGEERTISIADRAAPVIASATYKMGTALTAETPAINTLVVVFSESVVILTPSPFASFTKALLPYTFTLGAPVVNGNQATFIVQSVNGTVSPETGDLICIKPDSTVRDALTFQNNPGNRRVPLVFQRGAVKWDVVAAPNPFDPAVRRVDSAGVMIRLVNPLNGTVPLKIDKAHLSIYDAIGNAVALKLSFTQTANGPVCYWKGTNRKGRFVGSGTYIGMVTVEDEGSEGTKRVKIGVSHLLQ